MKELLNPQLNRKLKKDIEMHLNTNRITGDWKSQIRPADLQLKLHSNEQQHNFHIVHSITLITEHIDYI